MQQNVENAAFKNAHFLKVKEALILMQTAPQYGSAEYIELLDKIIGNHIYEVPSESLVMTIEAFLRSHHTRPKIFEALFQRVEAVVGELPLSDLTHLISLLHHFKGGFDHIYELIEPYIMNRMHVMTEGDLINCVHGFFSQT